MRERNVTIVWGFLFALVTQPALVRAQSAAEPARLTEQQKREASAHFNRGAELFTEGVYRGALIELQRAYEIAPNYRVLYNIGQTHVALGEFVEAMRAFETFLEQGGSAVDAERRRDLESQIELLAKRTARLTITVDRDGARVAVDAKQVGTSPLSDSIAVNVGRHRVSAQTEDGASASEEIDLAGGDARDLSLTLSAPTRAIAAAAPRAPAEPSHALSRRKKWAIGLLSGAGALGLSGLAVALIARSARDDHENAVRALPGDPVAINDAHDKLARTTIAADVLFGSAIAAGVAGAVLLLLREPKREAEAEATARLRIGLAPTGVVATGRF